MKNKFLELINQFDSFAILPHVSPDGDTLGSSFAIFQFLKEFGKEAYIVLDDEIPYNLEFAFNEVPYTLEGFMKNEILVDAIISIDSSDIDRLGERKILLNDKVTICIDHHVTNTNYCNYNFVNDKASSTGEVLYELIFNDEDEISLKIATYLYIAIITDTGSFKYSNTSPRTLDIASKLYKTGIDFENINVEVYQNISLNKFKFTNLILNTLELYENNKIAFVYITDEILQKNNIMIQDTDGIIEKIRDISTVELAVFAREVGKNIFKVSLRSKRYYDTALLALKFGGGGHVRASGFTVEGDLEFIRKNILKEIEFSR